MDTNTFGGERLNAAWLQAAPLQFRCCRLPPAPTPPKPLEEKGCLMLCKTFWEVWRTCWLDNYTYDSGGLEP